MIPRTPGWFVITILLLLAHPAALRGGPVEEFDRLYGRCGEQMEAGNLHEAERMALRLKQIAEGPLANQQLYLARVSHTLGGLYFVRGRYSLAEPHWKRALAIREKKLGPEHPDTAASLNLLASLYILQRQYSEAEPLLKHLLTIQEKTLGPNHPNVATSLFFLAGVYFAQEQYSLAETHWKRSLAIREKALGSNHPDVATSLKFLASPYKVQGRYSEAEPLYRRALAIREKALGAEHPETAGTLDDLGDLYCSQFRYDEAEALHKRALAIRETKLGLNHPDTAKSLNYLAQVYNNQGRYSVAEPLYKQALAIKEKTLGPNHPDTAAELSGLAAMYANLGRYAEAERLSKRALAMTEKAVGGEHSDTSAFLHKLAALYLMQGRYSEAEPLFKRALAIREKTLGAKQPKTAESLLGLAILYSVQGHYAEAAPFYRRSLIIGAKEPLSAVRNLDNVAILYMAQGWYARAEQIINLAMDVWENYLGPEHSKVAGSLNNLAILYYIQGRYSEAEPLYKRAFAIWEKNLGTQHPNVATSLSNLANLYCDQGRYSESEPLCNRAVVIMDKAGANPDGHCMAYQVRSKVYWQTDRRERAVGDLRRAMQIAERIRAQSSGSEIQQARSFAQYSSVFETMVGWQTELGNPAEGLEAIERSRARALVDQMATAGMDLLAGVDEKLAAGLRRREQEAQVRAAGLKKQLELLAGRKDLSADQRQAEQEKLQAQLRRARADYYAAYAEIRNASPAYRLAVGQDRKPVPLAKLKRRVADQDALLLEYLLGSKDGYVLIVPADGEPRLEKLAVTEGQAKSLGIDAGPLTAKHLEGVLRNDEETRLLQRLKRSNNPEQSKQAAAGLAALWEVLIPEAQRKAILVNKYKRLIVIPDGTLANLPFETLVVNSPEDEPEYLLDTGPPIQYAPSATILMNLAERQAEGVNKAAQPVLTVGDCRYGRPAQPGQQTLLAQLAPQARYGSLGGRLELLPHSRTEVLWISQVYGDTGTKVAWLKGDQATEAAVRRNAPGRRVLHFACHGLVDRSYGNLFGALAFTPGPDADDPANDGFLTLAEIYELDLKGCELTILSACDTNAGPQQRGEGVWALSRGFLVAGSRRVVASNWLVDDEAAASFVSYFSSILAKAEKEGRTPDHAEALHRTKRWARSQEKWKSPYYWGTFVLMGPN